MLTTGLTGCTSRSGLFGSVRRALGDDLGSGFSNGSDAGRSDVVEVLGACFEARRGRVDWAVAVTNINRTTPVRLMSRVKTDRVMASDCIRERVGFESSDKRLGNTLSDAPRSHIGCRLAGLVGRFTDFRRLPPQRLQIKSSLTGEQANRYKA